MREGGLDCPSGEYRFSCCTIFISLTRARERRQEIFFCDRLYPSRNSSSIPMSDRNLLHLSKLPVRFLRVDSAIPLSWSIIDWEIAARRLSRAVVLRWWNSVTSVRVEETEKCESIVELVYVCLSTMSRRWSYIFHEYVVNIVRHHCWSVFLQSILLLYRVLDRTI